MYKVDDGEVEHRLSWGVGNSVVNRDKKVRNKDTKTIKENVEKWWAVTGYEKAGCEKG